MSNQIKELEALASPAPTSSEAIEQQRRQLLRGDFVLNLTSKTEVHNVIGEIALRMKVIEPEQREEFENRVQVLHKDIDTSGLYQTPLPDTSQPTILSAALDYFYEIADDHHNGLHTDLMRRSKLFGHWLLNDGHSDGNINTISQKPEMMPPGRTVTDSLPEAV